MKTHLSHTTKKENGDDDCYKDPGWKVEGSWLAATSSYLLQPDQVLRAPGGEAPPTGERPARQLESNSTEADRRTESIFKPSHLKQH